MTVAICTRAFKVRVQRHYIVAAAITLKPALNSHGHRPEVVSEHAIWAACQHVANGSEF